MQVTLYTGSTGINNTVDPVRARFNPETGITDLANGVDIIIDRTGRISRQKGSSLIVAGEYHSLCPFDCGGYTLAVKGTSLYAIDVNGNEKGVRSGLSTGRMDYQIASDGTRDLIFYVNGRDRGIVWDRTSYSWELSDSVGPDSTDAVEGPPDNAHLLTLFNGRMYLASDNVIFPSQRQDYYKFIYAYGMHFRGRVTMLRAMAGGIYVSDQKRVCFLPGQDVLADGSWQPLGLKTVSNEPAIEGCNKKIESQYIGEGGAGYTLVWYSQDGVFAGSDDGTVVNMTKDKLSNRHPANGLNYLPGGTFGAMTFLNNERIILTVEP